jgi:hypothetical protein
MLLIFSDLCTKVALSPVSKGATGDAMVWKWLKWGLACSIAIMLPSCGHDQQLTSIEVRPAGFVFEGLGAQGQFTAIGTYIHPPQTKDITTQVVWTIDSQNLATITQTGLATSTRLDGCGSGNVTASHYSNPSNPTSGAVIAGSATVKGVNDGTSKCQP